MLPAMLTLELIHQIHQDRQKQTCLSEEKKQQMLAEIVRRTENKPETKPVEPTTSSWCWIILNTIMLRQQHSPIALADDGYRLLNS